MKHSILLAALCFIALISKAQMLFDARGAVNFSRFHEPKADDDVKAKLLPGFSVGSRVHIPSGPVTFIVGLDARQKGAKYKSDDTQYGLSDEGTIKLLYLEMPVQVAYYFNRKKTGIYMVAGGYMGYGIAGKVTEKMTYTSGGQTMVEKSSEDIDWGKDVGEVKPFDAGLSAGIGAQSKMGIFIQAEYNLGLANISNDDEYKAHNRAFAIVIGWRFGGKHAK